MVKVTRQPKGEPSQKWRQKLQASATLQEIKIFQNTPLSIIYKHLENCELHSYSSNSLILSPLSNNHNMYAVISGGLSIHYHSADSPSTTELGIGETVGEISIFDGLKPTAFVKTTGETQLLVISSQTLWSMVDNSHEISRNLLHILSNRVRSGNETILSNLELQRKHERDAQLDTLTGLHNRRWLDTTFKKELTRCKENNSAFSVIMLDIDHFKHFNDTYGHQAGDQVLKQVAFAMKDNLRPNEIVARYGGEEFVILLPNTSAIIAEKIAERVRLGVAGCYYQYTESVAKIQITISLGVAELNQHCSSNTLINNADKAMYQAKKSGRNQTQVYSYSGSDSKT
ncbi:MAG: GGDEF domain-containing protein [Gammaproteobacteria bacterium]|nr:GGDEF domain-containing protein [Gammaproteobacteria bacterium]